MKFAHPDAGYQMPNAIMGIGKNSTSVRFRISGRCRDGNPFDLPSRHWMEQAPGQESAFAIGIAIGIGIERAG